MRQLHKLLRAEIKKCFLSTGENNKSRSQRQWGAVLVLVLTVSLVGGMLSRPARAEGALRAGMTEQAYSTLVSLANRAVRVVGNFWNRSDTRAAAPSLQLTKSLVPASPTAIPVGKIFTYRLSWRCSGSISPQDDCYNMRITDVLPPDIEYVSVEVAAPLQSINVTGTPQTITLAFDPVVAAGVAGIVDIAVRYKPGVTLDHVTSTNIATLTADILGGGTSSVDSNPVTTTSVATDKTGATKSVLYGGVAGDITTYVIRVCSDSTSSGEGYLNYNNITMTDSIPSGVEFISAFPEPTTQPEVGASGTVIWNITRITAPCENYRVVVRYPNPPFSAGQSVTNSAAITGTLADGTTKNLTASVSHVLLAPNPVGTAAKSGYTDDGSPVQIVGGAINFSIRASNAGNVIIDQEIEDPIPAEIDVTRISTPDGALVAYQKNGVATWITGVPSGALVSTGSFPFFTPGSDYVSRLRVRINGIIPNDGNYVIIRGTVLNPSHGGGAYSLPHTITNTASVTTIYNNTPLAPLNVSTNFNVVGGTPTVYPYVTKENISGLRTVPTARMTFRISARAGMGTNATNLLNPVLTDLLPANLEYDSIVAITQGSAANCTSISTTPQMISNYNGSGRTLLKWSWTGSSPQCAIQPGGNVTVEYRVRVKRGAAAGDYTNVAAVIDLDNSSSDLIDHRMCGNGNDPYSGGAGVDENVLCQSSPSPYTIQSHFQLSSRKGVKGQLNDDGNPATDDFLYSGSTNVARTIRGGAMFWSLDVTNDGNIAADGIEIIDILPFNLPAPGNTGVGTGAIMGSTWRPLFLAPISAAGAPPGTKVYYTTTPNPCRPLLVSVAGCTAMTTLPSGVPQTDSGQWTDVFPADPTAIRAFRLDFGSHVLNSGGALHFEWPMSAPENAPIATDGPDNTPATVDDGNIAWNTFGFRAKRVDTNEIVATAPTRVGIEVRDLQPGLASYGNYVWEDVNQNGLQDEPMTGPTAKGINGVRVELWGDADGDAMTTNDQVLLGVKLTSNDGSGNPGYYLFPGLQPGKYFARFYPPADLPQVSPANAGGTNETNDSDGLAKTIAGQTVYESHVTMLMSGENYRDTDQGFYGIPISIGNTVWLDADGDGQIDASESGKNGVLVELFQDANGNGLLEDASASGGMNELQPLARQLTTGGGYYLFTQRTDSAGIGLGTPLRPGRYFIGISPYNFLSAGAPGTIGGQTFMAGMLAGYTSSGVFITNNGAISENAIAGNGTTDSDADNFDDGLGQPAGFYGGGVLSGILIVTAASEPTAEVTAGVPGATGGTTPGHTNTVNGLPAGLPIPDQNSNLSVDFGFFRMVLGNLVWRDNNNNGRREVSEPGIQGVRVELYDEGGNLLGSTVTNADGNYQFTVPSPGSYCVVVAAENFAAGAVLYNWVNTTGNGVAPDPDDDVDNDDNGSTLSTRAVKSGLITLAPRTEPTNDSDDDNGNLTVDFGFWQQGSVGPDSPPVTDGGLSAPGCAVLVFPVYTSNSVNISAQNTRINLTNLNPVRPALVHLFFVDGSTCSAGDTYLCLTPNQTAGFLASDFDPDVTGYLVAVAVDPFTGCPSPFNYLMGDEYVKFASGHQANLKPDCFPAISDSGSSFACNSNSTLAVLNFDGNSYACGARTLAADQLPSREDGNNTMLIVNRIGGNLSLNAATLTDLFGLVFSDVEAGHSFSLNPGRCQMLGFLSSAFPRTTPRYDSIIPSGRTGWLKLYSTTAMALSGAIINHNPNVSASASAYNQGHSLHHLTRTCESSFTIPVFPPSC